MTLTLLAGCAIQDNRDYALDPRAQFTSVPASRAWIALPDSALLTERRRDGRLEQRILLPNDTALPGDNLIFLRAVPNRPSGNPGRLSLDAMLDAIGGVPAPFDRASLEVLRSREDAAGTLTWTVYTTGAGTYCALAFRRLDETRRVVFLGAEAIHLAMRNCVRGSEDDALHPMRPEVVGFPAIGRPGAARAPQTLSPLAAPLP